MKIIYISVVSLRASLILNTDVNHVCSVYQTVQCSFENKSEVNDANLCCEDRSCGRHMINLREIAGSSFGKTAFWCIQVFKGHLNFYFNQNNFNMRKN